MANMTTGREESRIDIEKFFCMMGLYSYGSQMLLANTILSYKCANLLTQPPPPGNRIGNSHQLREGNFHSTSAGGSMKKSHFWLQIGCLAWLTGCGTPISSEAITPLPQGIPIPTSQFSGLFFTATDARYTSSALYWMNFRNGAVEQPLAGESGDPWIFWGTDRLLMVNRASHNNNGFFL